MAATKQFTAFIAVRTLYEDTKNPAKVYDYHREGYTSRKDKKPTNFYLGRMSKKSSFEVPTLAGWMVEKWPAIDDAGDRYTLKHKSGFGITVTRYTVTIHSYSSVQKTSGKRVITDMLSRLGLGRFYFNAERPVRYADVSSSPIHRYPKACVRMSLDGVKTYSQFDALVYDYRTGGVHRTPEPIRTGNGDQFVIRVTNREDIRVYDTDSETFMSLREFKEQARVAAIALVDMGIPIDPEQTDIPYGNKKYVAGGDAGVPFSMRAFIEKAAYRVMADRSKYVIHAIDHLLECTDIYHNRGVFYTPINTDGRTTWTNIPPYESKIEPELHCHKY
jgi:hypothetical protein